ncbi:MAG: TetR/AcrR family transcriptional regulator [Acidobacteriaceae bacterium]|nr:TetR/AcrR family transcriptional regulator [Acidobacteriaceae bacterium]
MLRGSAEVSISAHRIFAPIPYVGHPDIGVNQIALRLGVSPATLYRYIPGREPRTRSDDCKAHVSTVPFLQSVRPSGLTPTVDTRD